MSSPKAADAATAQRLKELLRQNLSAKKESPSAGAATSFELQVEQKTAKIEKMSAENKKQAEKIKELQTVIIAQGDKADKMTEDLKAKDEEMEKLKADLADKVQKIKTLTSPESFGTKLDEITSTVRRIEKHMVAEDKVFA
eukprot:COSAG04_NODE_16684_length_492_cov_0.760814_1_plen_140_part_01